MGFVGRLRKKRYAILLFSSYEKKKEITFSLFSLLIVLLVILSIAGANTLLVAGYVQKSLRAREADRLDEKLASYQLEFRKLAMELKDTEDSMIRLQIVDNRIRKLAHLDAGSNVLALGGPEEFVIRKRMKGLRENTQRLIMDFKRDLFRVRRSAEVQEESFHILEEFLRSREALLAHTPLGYPIRGWITSPFGYRRSPFTGRREFHEGIDIAAPVGAPIRVPADGVAVFAGRNGGYGRVVVVDHGYGFSTRYGHCSKILVSVGEKVKRGQVIARVGNTGRSTAPHLHYEVRVGKVAVNPYYYLKLGRTLLAYRN
jgi:murein DD-endopeptidase MepM/ murein hydrolase activator NlpD